MDKDNKGLTLSEMQQIIEETIKSLQEGDFDAKAEKIKKDWGGEEEPEEEFDAVEFFGDAGDTAEEDIKDEYGEEEFAPFGTMEDPRMLKDLQEVTDQERYEDVIFLQGSEAEGALKILNQEGPEAAIRYLSQWHDHGNGMGRNELPHGSSDDKFEKDGYHLAWNAPLGYIGLTYDHEHGLELGLDESITEDIKNFTGDIPYVPGKAELRLVKNEIEDLNPNYTMKFDALKVREKGLEISYDVDKGEYKVISDIDGKEYYNKIKWPDCKDCKFEDAEDVVEFIRNKDSYINEDSEHIINPASGLFRPQDSEGNDITMKALVTNLDGSKKGRVLGFGDDGAGSLVVRVDWQWPTDMKFMAPKEMGEKKEKPEELIVQNINEETMEENLNENEEMVMAKSGLHNAIMDYHNMGGSKEEVLAIVDTVFGLDETIEESGRGLGKGVKNSGDRNVKMRDDHHSAPLTNLNESVNNSIKSLLESKVTKKDLQNFIIEEAKNVAKQLKG